MTQIFASPSGTKELIPIDHGVCSLVVRTRQLLDVELFDHHVIFGLDRSKS
jgi:hypothetical protein